MPSPESERNARPVAWRWLAAGLAFGAGFPLIGWAFAGGVPNPANISAAHRAQPVLYIVDLAPLVLGVAGLAIGVFHDRLRRIRLSIEQTVEERTADLRVTLDQLATAQAELLSAQKLEAIGSLAAGIAHEINTPIQYIGDNTRFVDESLSALLEVAEAAETLVAAVRNLPGADEAMARCEQTMRGVDLPYIAEEVPVAVSESLEGIDQVAAIVRALKSFAHPGSAEKAPADLNEIIETTVAVSRSEWKHVADLDLSGLDPDLPMVPMLSGPLKQVILNIILNAVHAIEDVTGDSSSRGQISIATSSGDGCARIEIADTGGGIPDDVADRIFEPFFTTKEVGRGSGQGLAIARSIIGKHDGTLSFVSTPGVGTVFTISLLLETAADTTAPLAEPLAS